MGELALQRLQTSTLPPTDLCSLLVSLPRTWVGHPRQPPGSAFSPVLYGLNAHISYGQTQQHLEAGIALNPLWLVI